MSGQRRPESTRALGGCVLLLLLAWSIASAFGLGQAGHRRGRLSGIVLDAEGKPISSAVIILRFLRTAAGFARDRGERPGETAVFKTSSSPEGRWTYHGLASGIWEVGASKAGFSPARLEVKVSQILSNPRVTLRLERAAAPSPELKAGVLERAGALFWQQRYTEALPLYKQALDLDPEDVMTILMIGDCLRESGDFEGALLRYRSLVEKTADDPPSRPITAMAWTRIGEVQFKKGDRKAAIRSLTLALDVSPANEVTAANLGALLFEEGRTEEAVRYYLLAIGIAPARPDLHYKLGLVRLNRGEEDEARACFVKVMELLPGSALAEKAAAALEGLERD